MSTAVKERATFEVPTLKGSKSLVAHFDSPDLAVELGKGQSAPKGSLVVRLLLPKYGDKRFSWNPLNLEEIREAEEFFNKCIAEGLVPYRVGPGGKTSEPMARFEPGAGEAVFREIAARGEQVVMNPQAMVAGG